MQDCFRQHPDIYGAELDDDEENQDAQEPLDGGGVPEAGAVATPALPRAEATAATHAGHSAEGLSAATQEAGARRGYKVAEPGAATEAEARAKRERTNAAREQVKATQPEPTSEREELVPKAWHDASLPKEGK